MVFLVSEVIQFFYQFFSKSSRIIGLAGMLVLTYLAGYASPMTTLDYPNYETYYNLAPSGVKYFENGYTQLGLLGYKLGLNYAQFRVIFAFIIVIIMYIAVRRFTKNVAFFSATYGVTIFFIDATQIRNFMTISLVLLGMTFLIKISKKNVIIATLIILLSAQFQSIGYIFILVIVVRMLPKKILTNGLLFFLIINMILMFTVSIFGVASMQNLMIKIAELITSRAGLVEKISGRYVTGSSIVKILEIYITTTLGLIYSNYITNKFHLIGENVVIAEKLQVLYSGVIVSFMTLPLIYLAFDYSRVQRNGFTFIILISAIFFDKSAGIKTREKWVLIVSFVILSIGYGVVFCLFWGSGMKGSILYLAKILY